MHSSSSSTLLAASSSLLGKVTCATPDRGTISLTIENRRFVVRPTLYRMQYLPLSRQPAGHHPFLAVAASAPPHRAPFSGPSWLRHLLLREGQRRQQHGGDDQLQNLSASILHVLHLCFMVSVQPPLLWL
jgi:hypothetical protein